VISRAPTKAKSQEPAYSQTLYHNKIERQRSRCRESGRQTADGYGGWCLKLRRGGRYGEDDESEYDLLKAVFQFGMKALWRDGKGRGLSVEVPQK